MILQVARSFGTAFPPYLIEFISALTDAWDLLKFVAQDETRRAHHASEIVIRKRR